MLFEMINQEFKAQGTKYQMLPDLGICCRELRGLKLAIFRACVRSFFSIRQENNRAASFTFSVTTERER